MKFKYFYSIFIISIFLIGITNNTGTILDLSSNEEITIPKKIESLATAEFTIDGNTDLMNCAFNVTGCSQVGYGGGGNGTISDPYIIQNFVVNLNGAVREGILVQNTDAYFVIRDSNISAPGHSYSVAGIHFKNVANGRIESSVVVGNIFTGMVNQHSTIFGVLIEENSINCSINDLTVQTWYNDNLYPVEYAVYVRGSSSKINITNSELWARVPIKTVDASYLLIENNYLTGPTNSSYEALGPYVNIYYGILMQTTQYSKVISNTVWGYKKYGINILDSNSNTILENIIGMCLGKYTDNPAQLIETGTSTNNKFLKINDPLNGTIIDGVTNPNPGYYSGGNTHYISGEGFDYLPEGPFDASSNYYSSSNGWDYFWDVYGAGVYRKYNIINNKTDTSGFDHKKVLAIEKSTGATSSWARNRLTHPWDYDSSIVPTGTIELWILKEKDGFAQIDLNPATYLRLEGDHFSLWNGSAYNNLSGINFKNNKWYRISFDISGDKSYGELTNPYEFKFRIYDSDGITNLYTSPIHNYTSIGSVNYLRVWSQGSSSVEEKVYVDAIGYSWEYSVRSAIDDLIDFYGNSYEIGDNQNEGFLIEYNVQRRTSADSSWGTNDCELCFQSVGYVIAESSGTFDYDSAKAIFGNDFHYFYPFWVDFDWKFVVPKPEDGSYKIKLVATKNNDFSGIISSSDTIFFSSFFDTGIKITHYENGEEYPPGRVLLAENEDLNVTQTIRTYDWYDQDTWTQASYSYKINNGPWIGPIEFGNEYGIYNASFIIGEGNYKDFDKIYYYITYNQFDNDTNHIETYYAMKDLLVTKIEDVARDFPFQKKIAPIPYELGLDYTVFYQAQFGVEIEQEMYYPIIDILNEDIQVNFDNITSTLIEFNVTVQDEYSLDHKFSADTSNISRSLDPQFSYSDNLTSPFLIPLTWNLIIDTSNITFPLISLDYFIPGVNLSFTGDKVNLTYRGLENWPNSPLRPRQTMFKFTDSNQKITVRYDSNTGIMTYFEFLNDTVPLQTQKIIFALVDNNAGYPINLEIEQREEIISQGTKIIDEHLLAIVYDPPGDHSYGKISSGTTTTYSLSMGNSETTSETVSNLDKWTTAAGKLIGVTDETTNTTIATDVETSTFSVTYSFSLTSSVESNDPNLIGPGKGDLYYGTGILVNYYVKQRIYYIVVNEPDIPNENTDDIRLWNGTPWIEYAMHFESTFQVLGAYLDDYGLSHLESQFNIFSDNEITREQYTGEINYVEEIPNSPLFWTPNFITEIEYSTTSTTTVSYNLFIETAESSAFSFNSPLTGALTGGLMGGFAVSGAKMISAAVFGGLSKSPDIGLGMPTQISVTTETTTATEENRQIIAHLEDNDGVPIGQHDQFAIQVYRDLRYNTFGYIINPDFTFTSYPYESNTRDRRPPIKSEISYLEDFVHGNTFLQAIAIDDETGISYVKIYYDDDPTFGIDSEWIATLDDTNKTSLEMYLYELYWDTSLLEGEYYIFVETYDNAYPLKNHYRSSGYKVFIDNNLPLTAQASIFEPFLGVYYLYANVFDTDSGIDFVEYWDGDPDSGSSTLLGTSYDITTSYNYIWVIDTTGADDGIHNIFVRVFDRAGNYLDSSGVFLMVDSQKTEEPLVVIISETKTETVTAEQTTDTETGAASFPGLFTIVIFLLPVVVFTRRLRKK